MKISRILQVALLIGLAAPVWAGRKPQPETPLSTINFLIVRDENGKPIRNAAVVIHPVDAKDRQEAGGIELKTDLDGKAGYDGIPYGKMRIQVLASGFQTYGDDFDIGKPSVDITIKMKRPAQQYSIYQDHPSDNSNQKPK